MWLIASGGILVGSLGSVRFCADGGYIENSVLYQGNAENGDCPATAAFTTFGRVSLLSDPVVISLSPHALQTCLPLALITE